jgi:hypothetical protein
VTDTSIATLRETVPRRRTIVIATIVFLGACAGDENANYARGRGLKPASLSPSMQAAAYEAALRGAFELGDPTLSLLLDSRELPRTVGLGDEGRIPAAVASELQRRGMVKGTCAPPITRRSTPSCPAELPGYVVRFSRVFGMRGDSVEVYVFAQQYDTPSSGHSPPLRFERVYHLVRSGDGWRAALEGRVPKEVRGDR